MAGNSYDHGERDIEFYLHRSYLENKRSMAGVIALN